MIKGFITKHEIKNGKIHKEGALGEFNGGVAEIVELKDGKMKYTKLTQDDIMKLIGLRANSRGLKTRLVQSIFHKKRKQRVARSKPKVARSKPKVARKKKRSSKQSTNLNARTRKKSCKSPSKSPSKSLKKSCHCRPARTRKKNCKSPCKSLRKSHCKSLRKSPSKSLRTCSRR